MSKGVKAALVAPLMMVSGAALANINVLSGGTLSGTGNINTTVVVSDGGTVAPGTGDVGCPTVDGLTMNQNSILEVDINGVTACSLHDRIEVDGAVSLTGVTISVNSGGGYTPAFNDEIVLISNVSGNASAGGPNGSAEGDVFMVGGLPLSLVFAAGDGNDVALVYRTVPTKPIITAVEAFGGVTTFQITVDGTGQSAITGYVLSCSDGGAPISQTVSGPPLELTGLQADVNYACTVTAINSQGASVPSEIAVVTPSASTGLPIWLLYEASEQ